MKKFPIAILITDLHIIDSNSNQVFNNVKQAVDLAKTYNLEELYVLGDVFEARKAQPLDSLISWNEMINYAEYQKVVIRCFPGNHDKVSYFSRESYLDIYSNPFFQLTDEYRRVDNIIGDKMYSFHMIPYFDESIYHEYLAKVEVQKTSSANILLTHIAVNGVKNNDGSPVTSGVPIKGFDKFDKIFIGHYHNKQIIDNVMYIGSLYQKNFGEDDAKGISIVYNDLSVTQIPTEFKKFETVSYNIDDLSIKELESIASTYSKSDKFIRIKFTGTPQKIATIDKSLFDKHGIDIKCSYSIDTTEVTQQDAESFEGFDRSTILDEWDLFCQDKPTINVEVGKEKFLNNIK